MITGESITYFREDLRKTSYQKSIEDINCADMLCSIDPFLVEDIVIFVDHNSQSKILKSRYGDTGVIKKVIKSIKEQMTSEEAWHAMTGE